jgi:hypothetical protein
MHDFRPWLQTRQNLAHQHKPGLAGIPRIAAMVRHATASAKSRPVAPVLLQPNRQEQRHVALIHRRRPAGQKICAETDLHKQAAAQQ